MTDSAEWMTKNDLLKNLAQHRPIQECALDRKEAVSQCAPRSKGRENAPTYNSIEVVVAVTGVRARDAAVNVPEYQEASSRVQI